MSKYLKDSDIKLNHWYTDGKGEEYLYLGKAMSYSICWSYPSCYIYLKYSTLLRHYKELSLIESMPADKMLLDMAKLGIRHYQFSQKPRKFTEEIGKQPHSILHGEITDGENTFVFD